MPMVYNTRPAAKDSKYDEDGLTTFGSIPVFSFGCLMLSHSNPNCGT